MQESQQDFFQEMYTFFAFDFHKLISTFRQKASEIHYPIQNTNSWFHIIKKRNKIFEFQVGDKGQDAI